MPPVAMGSGGGQAVAIGTGSPKTVNQRLVLKLQFYEHIFIKLTCCSCNPTCRPLSLVSQFFSGLTVQLHDVCSLLPPGGDWTVQPRPRPVRAEHRGRGVVTRISHLNPAALRSRLFLLLQMHYAAVEHSAPAGWGGRDTFLLPGHSSGLDRDWNGHHDGHWALSGRRGVLKTARRETSKWCSA